MPRLHCSRIVGVAYDKSRIMDDISYFYKGMDTLKILENGGGKTTTIQLLIQPILPNRRVGPRHLKDVLIASRHGHIALEWMMDGGYYIITGFYFSINRDNNGYPLSYHTYVYEHKGETGKTLESLPFLQKGKVLSWRELKTHFSKTMSMQNRYEDFTNSKEEMRLHADKLRSYNIVPEEFEAVIAINGDEGDVENYFATANTEERLLRKIIIPRVEAANYPSEEKREILAENFLKYAERIMNIPVMKKQISQLEHFEGTSRQLLEHSAQTYYAKEEFISTLGAYRGALRVLEKEKEILNEKKEKLEIDRQFIGKNLRELQWKIDSYPLFLEQGELQKIQKELKQHELSFEKLKRKRDELEEERKRIKAFLAYSEYKAHESRAQGFTQQIKDLDKQEPELKEQEERAQSIFRYVWEKEFAQIEKDKADVIQSLREQEDKQTTLTQEKEALIARITQQNANLSAIYDWLEKYEDYAQMAEKTVGAQARKQAPSILCEAIEEIKRGRNRQTEISSHVQQEQDVFYSKTRELDQEKTNTLELLRKNFETLSKEQNEAVNIQIEKEREEMDIYLDIVQTEKEEKLGVLQVSHRDKETEMRTSYTSRQREKENALQIAYESFVVVANKKTAKTKEEKTREISYLEDIIQHQEKEIENHHAAEVAFISAETDQLAAFEVQKNQDIVHLENTLTDQEKEIEEQHAAENGFVSAESSRLAAFEVQKNQEISRLEDVLAEQEKKIEKLRECHRGKEKEFEKHETFLLRKQHAEKQIRNTLHEAGYTVTNLYRECPLKERLSEKLEHVIEKQRELDATYRDTRIRYKNLSQRGFLPSHPHLLTVRDYLIEHGVYAELGKEYVIKNGDNSASKLLVHAILIQEGDHQKIEQILAGMGEWMEEVPIFFMTEKTKNGPFSLFQQMQEGLYMYNPSDIEVYASHEKTESLKRKLKEQLTDMERQQKDFENSIQILRGTLTEWTRYEKEFPETQVQSIEEECNACKQILQQQEEQMQFFRENVTHTGELLKAARKEIIEERYQSATVVAQKQNEIKINIAMLQERIANAVHLIRELRKEINEARNRNITVIDAKKKEIETIVSTLRETISRNRSFIKNLREDIDVAQQRCAASIDQKRKEIDEQKEKLQRDFEEKLSKQLLLLAEELESKEKQITETTAQAQVEIKQEFSEKKAQLTQELSQWMTERQEQYKNKVAQINADYKETSRHLSEMFLATKEQWSKEVQILKKREVDLSPVIEVLQIFVPYTQEVTAQQERLTSETLKQEQYTAQKEKTDREIFHIETTMKELRAKESRLESARMRLLDHKTEMSLTSSGTVAPSDKTYEDAKQMWNSTKDALVHKQIDRKLLEQNRTTFEGFCEKAKAKVLRTRLSFEWVALHAVPVTEDDDMVIENNLRTHLEEMETARSVLERNRVKYTERRTGHKHNVQHFLEKHGTNGYTEWFAGFTVNHLLEHTEYVATFREQDEKFSVMNDNLEEISGVLQNIEQVFQIPSLPYEEESEENSELSQRERESMLKKPISYMQALQSRIHTLYSNYDKKKSDTRQTFKSYIQQIEGSQETLRPLMKRLNTVLHNNLIYDYAYVQKEFLTIYEAIHELKKHYRQELEESEMNKNIFVDKCMRKAEIVFDGVLEIPSYSKISIRGKDKNMFKFEWTKWGDWGKEKLQAYVDSVIETLLTFQKREDGMEKTKEYASQAFSTVQILNELTPIKRAKIHVIKPRNYEEMQSGNIGREEWREVISWSGGEKTAVYMTLFMILINYIRTQNRESSNPWKVIFADNPFGKASSGHIVQPMFEIAKRNQVQMICLTAHRTEEIARPFPVVYSLKLRQQLDNAFLRATEQKGKVTTLENSYFRNEKGEVLPITDTREIVNHKTFKETTGQMDLFTQKD